MEPSGDRTSANRPSAVGTDAQLFSVHDDLTVIFSRVSPDLALPSAGQGTVPRVDRSRERRLRTFAVAAVILLLIGASMIFAWSRRPSSTVEVVRPAPQRRALSFTPEPRPSIAAPGETEVDVAALPSAPSPVEPIEVTKPRERANAKAVAVDHVRKPSAAGAKRDIAAIKGGSEPRGADPDESATPDCSPADEAWCLRGATAAADRDLRHAYGVAVQSKVDLATLKHVRREWVRYRRLANKRPKELLRGYAELTVDLRRSASEKMQGDGFERAR